MDTDAYLDLPDDSTNSLYPALFQCFTIILCGYIAGSLNLVSQTESKGIGTFVGTFALPSLIFLSLAKLDFSTVNWTFLVAILIAKGVIFFGVIIVTLIISKPTHLGRAGIFAIFCTQSNDFALGYPIISAIYQKTHPEYALYLYLMAPISLAILNPVAFVLMEIHKQRETSPARDADELQRGSMCTLKLLRQIVKGIAFNPVLVMTVLGILGNVLFKHQLSVYIEGLLNVLGQSFSATALFLLGLRMVGQVHRLRGPALLLPIVLIMVKLLVLPVAMRECVGALGAGGNDSDTLSLSTFAFLYGTVPTAPAVFVFSNLYQLELDLIASSMVVCTLLSAPMMFVSAQLITISADFPEQLKRFGYDISIASLVAGAWVLLVFLVTRKCRRAPHRLTVCLILSQSRGPCFVVSVWPVLCFVAWGAPAVMVAVLLVTRAGDRTLDGRATGAIRLCVLVFCLTVSAGSLIAYMRLRRRRRGARSPPGTPPPPGEDSTLVDHAEPVSQTQSLASNGLGCYGSIAATPPASPALPARALNNVCCSDDPRCESALPTDDIEDIVDSTRECACPASQRARCSTQSGACRYLEELDRTADSLGLLPAEQRGRAAQLFKHTLLVVTYSLTMFIGVTYTTWSMMSPGGGGGGGGGGGVLVGIQFLDVAANYGQALVMLVLFGLDPDELFLPAVRALRSRWLVGHALVLPACDELSFETRQVCEQFLTHHLQRCREDIAKDRRWRMRAYKGVFRGACLVRWLVARGLARDAQEATQYGRHLLDGRLIAHIRHAHHFTDSSLLYTFVN